MTVIRATIALLGTSVVESVPWTYRDFDQWDQPSDWTCNSSVDPTQAPIDLIVGNAQDDRSLETLNFTGLSVQGVVDLEENTHYWEVVVPEDEQQYVFVTWKGKDFFMKQFHYHSPSENMINGKYFDMEAHHVHQAKDGQYLVLAVMMDATDDVPNPFIDKFWGEFPDNTVSDIEETITCPYHTEPTGFLPEDKTYYYFDGSFTTPPCTLDVVWILMRQKVTISVKQRNNFRKTLSSLLNNQLIVRDEIPDGVGADWDTSLGENNRPVQPIGDRIVRIGGLEKSSVLAKWWFWTVVLGPFVLFGVVICACSRLNKVGEGSGAKEPLAA